MSGFGLCYRCRAGRHADCLAIPCECPCEETADGWCPGAFKECALFALSCPRCGRRINAIGYGKFGAAKTARIPRHKAGHALPESEARQ